MAKLKFDRSINLELKKGDSVTVPNDEVWKGFLLSATDGWEYNQYSNLNNIQLKQGGTNTENGNLGSVILGGVPNSLIYSLLQGLRSRLLANIFAKEVSLA